MKQIVLLMVMLIFPLCASRSQVETKLFYGEKATTSLRHLSALKTIMVSNTVSLSSQNVAQKIQEYKEKEIQENRFGVPIDVNYYLNNGSWETIEDGKIWSMKVHSENAVSLTFFFNNLYLPEGAELYIINDDESVCYGPVTHDALTEKGHYLSSIIPGSSATIYLFEPSEVEGQSALELSKIIYGCMDFESDDNSDHPINRTTIYYPQSVACYPAWTNTSDGVGTIIFSDGTYTDGALLMETGYSFEPYLLFNLKSVHSANDSNLTSLELAKICTMAVTFRAREVSCGSNSQMTSYTYNGAYLKACWHETNFVLACIAQDVKQQKNITWLGWDNSGNTPSQGTWIGKYGSMYSALSYTVNGIATSENPYTHKYEWNAVENWDTIRVSIEGSPLFNPDKQVIGFMNNNTCYGDGYSCYWFSKFGSSWTGGGQNNNRLSNHLDVGNKGFSSVNSCHPISIEGPISASGSAVYYVDNLPNDFTVHWYFPQNQYCNQHCLYEDTPSTNQCTVIPDSQHNMTGITLRAFLWRGSTYVTCMDKTITVNYGRQNLNHVANNEKDNLYVSNVGNVITAEIFKSNGNNQPSWIIEVYDATTGEMVFRQKVTNTTCNINAITWKSGIYIVRATVEKDSFSKKVVIK